MFGNRGRHGGKYNSTIEPYEEPLLRQLKDIVAAHPDVSSYAYIRDLHKILAIVETDRSSRSLLNNRLRSDVNIVGATAVSLRNPSTKAFDFTLYYCLALFCKRTGKVNRVELSLEKLIQTYGEVFKEFPLSLEVQSWYARRIQNLDEAFRIDSELICRLRIDQNAGIYTSFASSVALRLEKEYFGRQKGESVYYWADNNERIRDWTRAQEYMPKVIECWKITWQDTDGYGKHYFVYGKLILFSPIMGGLSPEQRQERIDYAREQFRMAITCEHTEDPDYSERRAEYQRYLDFCDDCLEFWQTAAAPTNRHSLKSYGMKIKNRRTDISKPNEDDYVNDDDNGIYLLADGVTRPHCEYETVSESLAAVCASELCRSMLDEMLSRKNDDVALVFTDAMKKANAAIGRLRVNQESEYYPCTTFIGAVVRGDTLYFSNCCDTVGMVIRNNVKITISEHHNAMANRLKLSKSDVYSQLHNNKAHPGGFGIFNGDDAIADFLQVGRLTLVPGDRIILATDGLAECLYYTRAELLAGMTIEEVFEASEQFDVEPYRKYADDKACVIIDIIS